MTMGVARRIRTTDPDEARSRIAEAYCPHGMTLRGRPDGFVATQAEGGVGAVRVFGLDYGSTDVRVTPVAFDDFVLVSRPVRGRLTVRGGGGERQVAGGEVVALDAHTVYELDFEQGCRLITVRVPRTSLEEVARGTARRGPVHFALETSPGPATSRTWDAITRLLINGPAGAGPLLDRQIERTVATAVLECFGSATDSPRARPVGPRRRRAVDAAVAFVREAAGEDIGLDAMAAAAGVSPRVLQEAFREHLDRTPLQHLREVRLGRARDELRAAGPGTTVAAVAHRWGFGNLGRFADAYRRTFGHLPHVDLRG